MSPFRLPAFLGSSQSVKNEDVRRKLTEELDRQLPGYQQSKREVGRILKELKAFYCLPGCRGRWQPFLRSRGLAVSTANDLIRRYTQGDSSAVRPGKPRGPKQPAELMTLKLPISAGERGHLKAAIAKLGRDRVAALIYSTVTQAAAQSDAPICSQEPKLEPRRSASPGPNTWMNYRRNFGGTGVESAGSGRFQHVEAPSPDRFSSPASRQTGVREAGMRQPGSAQSGSAQSGSAQSGSAQSGSAQSGSRQGGSVPGDARQGGKSILLSLAGLLGQRPSRLAEPIPAQVEGAARPSLESAGSGRFHRSTPPLQWRGQSLNAGQSGELLDVGPGGAPSRLTSRPSMALPGEIPARAEVESAGSGRLFEPRTPRSLTHDSLFLALVGKPEPACIRNESGQSPQRIPDAWGELLGAALEPSRPAGEGCPWFLSPYDSDGRRLSPQEIRERVTRKILLPALLKIGYETPTRP